MNPLGDIVIYYLFALLFLGAFHPIAWCIRMLLRKGKTEQYKKNLFTYMKWVLIYLTPIALFMICFYFIPSIQIQIETLWFRPIVVFYIYTLPIVFPIYYWKNIVFLKKKNLTDHD